MQQPYEHVLDFVDDYVHGALSASEALYVERHCESCRICKVALEEAHKRQAAFQTLPAVEPSERLVPDTLAYIDKKDRERTRLRKWLVRGLVTATAASVLIIGGFHLYYARLAPTPYDLRILGQTRLFPGSMGGVRVQLLHHDDGKPLEGVPVDIELLDKGEAVQLISFTTDADGTGAPRFQLPDWVDGSYILRVVAHPQGEDEIATHPIMLKRSWKLMLSSDKPVYQPGQTIQVRGLALRQPDLKPVAGQAVTFTIADPKSNIIFKKKDVTSKFGIASIDCPLATEILEGPYRIDCQIGDTQSALVLEVKKYVLPKFKVEVALDQPYYGPGQRVKGKVRADYFFGKPVADGTVAIEVNAAGGEKPLENLELHTDKEGVAPFDFTLPKELIGREQDTGDGRFTVQVAVTDTAKQKQTRSVSRVVTVSPLRFEVIPENGALVPGVANRIYLYVSYADGRPAKARLAVAGVDQELHSTSLGVTAFEVTPKDEDLALTIKANDDTGLVSTRTVELKCSQPERFFRKRAGRFVELTARRDFLVRTDKAVYDGGDTVKLIVLGWGVEPVFVDLIKNGQTVLTQTIDMNDGRGQFEFDLPLDLFGMIEMCAYRFDAVGLAVRKTRALFVRPATQLGIQATMDRQEYRPGAQAKLDLTLTDHKGNPTPGAFSLAAVDEAVFSVLEQAPGMERTFFMLEQQLLKPVYAIYDWTPDQTNGPVLAERNLFDQALLARTWQMSVEQPREADGRRVSARIASARPFAEGRPPYTLAMDSFPTKESELEKTRDTGLRRVTFAWSLFGIALALVAYASLWLIIRWQILLTIHAVAAGLILFALFITFLSTASAPMTSKKKAITKKDDPSDSRGTGAPKDASFRPPRDSRGFEKARARGGVEVGMGDFSVRREPGRGGVAAPPPFPDDGQSETILSTTLRPRVRDYFPETLLWRPEVITDERGRASLDIPLADSITTWRLSTSAVTADGRLGSAQAGIRVFQPFFVDLNLPVALTRGDEVAVPVVVHNYLAKPQAVELKLNRADWFELDGDLGDLVQRIELGANAVRSTAYRIRVNRVGNHRLQVTARTGKMADTVRRDIEVVPDGRRVDEIHNGTLQKPASFTVMVPKDAIEGSPKAILKIYPSSFSQLVEGLDGIFQRPYGCFEQTSSTTYPNVLALDYLKRTKKSAPEVEAKARQFIHLGYQRLLGFEVSGGGFDWFGHPPANLTLTAYGLMEFQDMASVHDVDPELIKRTRKWILSKHNLDGSWSPDDHGVHGVPIQGDPGRLATTAYVAWAVWGGGYREGNPDATRDYLITHKLEKIDDPYVLALVCNALLALDPKSDVVERCFSRLDGMKFMPAHGKTMWWPMREGARTTFYGGGHDGSVETTALATLAYLKAGRDPGTTRRALAWLTAQKDARGTWRSTQATVLALKALLAAADRPLGGDQERRIDIAFDNVVKERVRIPADQAEVMRQLDLTKYLSANVQTVTITERSQTAAGFQFAYRYHVPGEVPNKNEPLTINIAYDRDELKVGDTIKATATVVNKMKQVAPMVILDLPIPAGFAIDADDLTKLVQAETIAKYQLSARQAVVYLRGLEPDKLLKLEYHLKATMPVKLTVPPAQVYEYYDTDKRGRSAAANMTVK
jgi:hypothetical protein